jgi:hypothetical protein
MSLLSRWSGGLVTRHGAKLPLVAGSILAAIAFALLAVPRIGGSYWTTFFPGMTVLGLALAITVAPLSTAVMGAVDARHVGAASGINNTAARVAGLLAIAVMSVIIVHAFSSALESRLAKLQLPPSLSRAIDTQRTRLAAIEVPPGLPVGEAQTIHQAIGESFVTGFRVVCWVAAGLALAGALIASVMIESPSS